MLTKRVETIYNLKMDKFIKRLLIVLLLLALFAFAGCGEDDDSVDSVGISISKVNV